MLPLWFLWNRFDTACFLGILDGFFSASIFPLSILISFFTESSSIVSVWLLWLFNPLAWTEKSFTDFFGGFDSGFFFGTIVNFLGFTIGPGLSGICNSYRLGCSSYWSDKSLLCCSTLLSVAWGLVPFYFLNKRTANNKNQTTKAIPPATAAAMVEFV